MTELTNTINTLIILSYISVSIIFIYVVLVSIEFYLLNKAIKEEKTIKRSKDDDA